jgi:hypothetical protein
MLGKKLFNSQSSWRRARQLIERRVALEEGDSIVKILQNGQHLAEAPYAGAVQRFGGTAPLSPEPSERAGIRTVMPPALDPARVFHFKEVAALDAAEVRLGLLASDARPASKTAQLMQIVVHTCC